MIEIVETAFRFARSDAEAAPHFSINPAAKQAQVILNRSHKRSANR
jgi:hypothetical protein